MLRQPYLRLRYQDLNGFEEHVDSLIAAFSASESMLNLLLHFFRFRLATTSALSFSQPVESLE